MYRKNDNERDQWFQRIKELPSEWQNPAGYNTIDLKDTGNAISTYIEEIVKVWRASRKRANKDLKGLKGEKRRKAIDSELKRLEREWKRKADPLYDFAGKIGIRKAISLTSVRIDQSDIDDEIAMFRSEQYLYLRKKLLEDLRSKLRKSIDERAVTQTTEEAYNSQEYRIAMYAGALLALAYLLSKVGIAGSDQDPLTEWIGVGDKNTCGTCASLDGGIKPLSQRDILPAQGTECFTRCRCILSFK